MVQEIENRQNSNVLGFAINGKVTSSDVEQVERAIETKLNTNDKIRVYTEIRDHDGWTFGGFFKDLTQKVKYAGKIEKAAVIGDDKWETPSDLAEVFANGNVERFNLTEAEQAKQWIRGEATNPSNSPSFNKTGISATERDHTSTSNPDASYQNRNEAETTPRSQFSANTETETSDLDSTFDSNISDSRRTSGRINTPNTGTSYTGGSNS